MASLDDLFNGDDDDADALRAKISEVETVAPTVALMLSGRKQTAKLPAIGKSSINFFLDGGGLNCSITQKEGERVIFVRISDPLKPWHSIENAIKEGDFSAKKKDVRRPSF